MIDRAGFLKARLPEREVDVPGVGTVRVRGLSRGEALRVQGHAGDTGVMERLIVALGLVEPVLSEEDVAVWYAAAPAGEVDLVVNPIVEMSGLAEGAPKSGVSEV